MFLMIFLLQRVTLIKDHLCTLKLLKSTKSSFFEPRKQPLRREEATSVQPKKKLGKVASRSSWPFPPVKV